MEKSKVYFANMRTSSRENILQKLERLLLKAGIENINFKNKFVAVKMHFGEPGNVAFIRPNFVNVVIKTIKDNWGIPFLTDSSTLYLGKRSNAIDHLETANQHGFNQITCGSNVIIADGIKGTDYKEIEINQKNFKTAKIGAAIADADIVVSINHFKGHDMCGFGGALKNLGMGSGSKAGKLEMHSSSKPKIVSKNCMGCRQCINNCPQRAINIDQNKKAIIDYDKCIGCGQCIAMCLYSAAEANLNEKADILNEKISEYAYAVLKGKPNFHINFIIDVSPNCDCWPYNDAPIVPDIGIAASFDPVALDKACLDLVNRAEGIRETALNHSCNSNDKFEAMYPSTDAMQGLIHAQNIGLGKLDYELINIDK